MTKEITKAFILQEIQDKFNLRELEPEKFRFSEMVVPTYSIGQHLLSAQIKKETVSVAGGPASFLFFTVPEIEKWHLHGYNLIFVTGSYKVAGVMINRPAAADYFYLDLTKNQTVSYSNLLPKDVVLCSGDRILVYVDDYTSAGNLLLHIDVTVETVR